MPLVEYRELSGKHNGEASADIRRRIVAARNIQRERFKGSSARTNAGMGPRQVRTFCELDKESSTYLEHAMEQLNFSARAHDRILKVARTLADLEGVDRITANHILEAIQYRSLDRNLFA